MNLLLKLYQPYTHIYSLKLRVVMCVRGIDFKSFYDFDI